MKKIFWFVFDIPTESSFGMGYALERNEEGVFEGNYLGDMPYSPQLYKKHNPRDIFLKENDLFWNRVSVDKNPRY